MKNAEESLIDVHFSAVGSQFIAVRSRFFIAEFRRRAAHAEHYVKSGSIWPRWLQKDVDGPLFNAEGSHFNAVGSQSGRRAVGSLASAVGPRTNAVGSLG